MKSEQLFMWNGQKYSFIRVEQHGRIKAAHCQTGIRVSLPANSIQNAK